MNEEIKIVVDKFGEFYDLLVKVGIEKIREEYEKVVKEYNELIDGGDEDSARLLELEKDMNSMFVMLDGVDPY